MATIMPLPEAIAEYAADGQTVSLEGFTHLIPFAAAHEILRQGRSELTLVRMTPDMIYDQMIGMGRVRKLVFSYAGNPGVGGLPRMRDAVENDWPAPLSVVEHSHAGLTNAYVAGASKLPFAVLRGYAGTGLAGKSDVVRPIECPFTGESLSAVRAVNPDLGVIHAQQADRHGNVMLWGISGVQKEAVLASRHSIVTVEEIVDELEPRPRAVVLPGWVVDAVAQVPGGSWPSYAADYSTRDNDFYREWDTIARDRDAFTAWMQENVIDSPTVVSPAAARALGAAR